MLGLCRAAWCPLWTGWTGRPTILTSGARHAIQRHGAHGVQEGPMCLPNRVFAGTLLQSHVQFIALTLALSTSQFGQIQHRSVTEHARQQRFGLQTLSPLFCCSHATRQPDCGRREGRSRTDQYLTCTTTLVQRRNNRPRSSQNPSKTLLRRHESAG